MKKFIKIVCTTLALVLAFIFAPILPASASAVSVDNSNVRNLANVYLKEFVNYGYTNKPTVNRAAGSMGETMAAVMINNCLSGLLVTNESNDTEQTERIAKLEAKNNSSTTNGLQKFEFFNNRTNKKEQSQNIIYTLKGKSSDKKVVLSSVYDNYYTEYFDENGNAKEIISSVSEGVNASGASVAVLLTLANVLPANQLDYDVEFVFLGASYAGNCGTEYYLQTQESAERERTLLFADISNIALGENLYFYSGAFGAKQDNFYKDTLNFKKYSSGISGASQSANTTLGYINAGYNGTTVLIEGNGYNILHIFAGAYDNGVVSGLREYTGKANITNTQEDSLDYIFEHYGSDVSSNMEKVINAITNMLVSDNFTSELSKNNWALGYKVFGTNKYINIATIVTLIILGAIAVLLHYRHAKQSYDFLVQNQITDVAIRLDDEDKK